MHDHFSVQDLDQAGDEEPGGNHHHQAQRRTGQIGVTREMQQFESLQFLSVILSIISKGKIAAFFRKPINKPCK